jgi:hypothetical protein
MVIGLALTLVARLLFVSMKLNTYIGPAAIVYPCLMALFTLAAWLAFFRN